MNQDDDTAHQIASDLLMKTGEAVMRRDFDAFATHFDLPHDIITFDGHVFVKDRAEFVKLFEKVLEMLDNNNVTEMVRYVEQARFSGPQTIQSTHVSHMMSRHFRVVEPYPCISTLQETGGRWRITKMQYALPEEINWALGIAKTRPEAS